MEITDFIHDKYFAIEFVEFEDALFFSKNILIGLFGIKSLVNTTKSGWEVDLDIDGDNEIWPDPVDIYVCLLRNNFKIRYKENNFLNTTIFQFDVLLKWVNENLYDNVIDNIYDLYHTEELEFKYSVMVMVPESFSFLSKLKVLIFNQCESLRFLPENINKLSNLQNLYINWSEIESIPLGVFDIPCLRYLHISSNELEEISEDIYKLDNLETFTIEGCKKLNNLPDRIGQLKNLKSLKVSRLDLLQEIPESIGLLENLQNLYIENCKNLNKLPDSIGNLKNIDWLSLNWNYSLKYIPDTIGKLEKLRVFQLILCKKIEILPESITNLENLEYLILSFCKSLRYLPCDLYKLPKLESLKTDGCDLLLR